MDKLNYFKEKLGYDDRFRTFNKEESFNNQKARNDWEYNQRELERKRKEEERRKRLAEEKRRIEKQKTEMNSINSLANIGNDKNESKNLRKDNSGFTINNNASRIQGLKGFEKSIFEKNKDEKEEFIKPYKEFNYGLRSDIKTHIDMQREAGVKDEDIFKSLIPEEDTSIEDRLKIIESKIKPGPENVLYNVKEGWYEREIQNMLSKEYVRKMNNLPNKADEIETFLEENPEIGDYKTGKENIFQKFWQGGTRFLGSGTRLQYDSYKESAKDPMSYVWAGTMLAEIGRAHV